MPKKRPTEVGWDSDEDILLEDSTTLGLFGKKFGNDEEFIDEDVLLGIKDDKSTQNKNMPGESFELFIDEKEMGTFDETVESQELDYEDTYQEEEVSQEYTENEPELLVVSETPNQTVTKIQPIKAEVFGAKTGESDNSDSDEEKKSRGRFKTERQTINLKTPLFTKAAAIPDSLEVTKEMQEEIDNFNQQQGKKGKQWKNNRKNIPQQQQRPNQAPHPQQFQNKMRPVRPVQHQQFPRGPRPQGNNQRPGGPRFTGPRHFGPRGPHQNFQRPRPVEQVNTGNFRPVRPGGPERGPVPLFPHEVIEMQGNPHNSPGPQPHSQPPRYEQPPQQPQQQPQQPPGPPVPYNHGYHPGPGQPRAPFSPPPQQSQPQSQVVHVNPNFQGPIPQEAFSYQQQPPRYPPNPQPQPPYPTTSQPGPGPRPQHFQQPAMPPNSVQPQHPPQQFNQPRQPFPPQQGYPPQGPHNSSPQMNYPPQQRPPHQPRPMDMPRPRLMDVPVHRPGFAPQQGPRPPVSQPGPPRPLMQTGPRPLIPQQHQHQQHVMRGPPPPHPNQQQPPHRTPNPVGQQIPPRFQGHPGPQRHPAPQNRPPRFQSPNQQGPPGPGPAPGPLQQPGGFNPTPDQFNPRMTDEERMREEQETQRKIQEMEEKKRKRAERFSKNEPVEIATTSGNLKVIKTTTKLGQKRTSTSDMTEISPAKIIKMEFKEERAAPNADADLQAKLEKQKMIREKIQRQKEARRQAEAESRRQKLTEKLASEGKSLEEFEKEQRQASAIKKIQGQIQEQKEHYKRLKQQQQHQQQQQQQQQQQNTHNINRQQSVGMILQKINPSMAPGQGRPNVGRGEIIQGQQGRGRGRGRGGMMDNNVGRMQKERQGGQSQQNLGNHSTTQMAGNRTVVAQGTKGVGMNSMGAASQGQTVVRKVNSGVEDQRRTVLPGGNSQRRIVLDSANSQPTTVSIEGLTSNPDLGKINNLCTSVGTVENFNYKVEERRVLVQFASRAQANKFVAKYNRYMLDLTHIKVRLVPTV